MTYQEILDTLSGRYAEILQENLVGVYAHGSIALGCFQESSSDIDYVIVVREEPSQETKEQVLSATVALAPYGPPKGLEMHMLLLSDCKAPRHPVFFCLHYSNMHADSVARDPAGFVRAMRGNDPDLAAHLTILHAKGICWTGLPTEAVFGPVPREDYLDSILSDVFGYDGGAVYTLCNLCRVWGFVAQGLVLSKESGPKWALAQKECPFPEAIEQAMHAYTNQSPWPADGDAQPAIAALREIIHALLPRDMQKRYPLEAQ